MTRQERIEDENKKMRKLRRIVDLTSGLLYQLPLTEESALSLIETVRKSALILFPGREDQFDLIYRPRFYRILRERHILNVN
ncbi:MAG: hypothetical protein ACE5GH_02605 [Fidelibacterota bacterium]